MAEHFLKAKEYTKGNHTGGSLNNLNRVNDS